MFAIHTGRAIAAALVLTVVPAVGFASTFDVLQQRTIITDDGTGNKSVSGQISIPDGTGQEVINTSAGSFHLKKRAAGTTDAYADFIAFCIEVTQTIDINTAEPATVYTKNNGLFGSDRRTLMATLLGTAFDPTQDAKHHAATQLALWKLAYGDISTSAGDAFDVTAQSFENLGGGFLSFDADDVTTTFESNSAGVFALAQSWLNKLNGDGDDWILLPGNRISFLTASGSQNLVTYTTPVPVPAAGGLLVGAIAGLAVLRRRRHTT